MRFYYFTIIIFTLGLISCDNEDNSSVQSTKHVLFAYLAGDNNLSSQSDDKFATLCQGFPAAAGQKLIIYLDNGTDLARLYEVKLKDGVRRPELIREYGEHDSADPEFFGHILSDMSTLYPSPSYGMVLFSHGSGWLPGGKLASPSRSIIEDKGSEMEIYDLAKSIPDGFFDYIVLETCFSAGVEVIYELKNKADRIVCSSAEILDPGFTHVYRNSLSHLYNGPSGLKFFAEDAYDYFNALGGYMQSFTVSVIKTAGISPLATWLSQNIDPDIKTDVSYLQHFDCYEEHLFYDAGQYFRSILPVDKRNVFDNLLTACMEYDAATPYYLYTPDNRYNGFRIERHSGMTSYVHSGAFPELDVDYKNTSWYKVVFANM